MNERLRKHYLPLISLVFIARLIFYFKRANRGTINLITQATGYISLLILSRGNEFVSFNEIWIGFQSR